MKYLYGYIVFFILLTHSYFVMSQLTHLDYKQISIVDEMKFKLKYGWLTIGEGKMNIDYLQKQYDGNDACEIIIKGRTAGLAGMFSKVSDTWGAIIDRENYLPYFTYRNISEGTYKLLEHNYFNWNNMTIKEERYQTANKEKGKNKFYVLKNKQTYDMIGGMMYARFLDFTQLNTGDTISITAFHEGEFYTFNMIYQGQEFINSKVGKINCFRMLPIIPKSPLFRGKTPIIFWISADRRRLPVRVKANMFFGTAYSHLVSFHEKR